MTARQVGEVGRATEARAPVGGDGRATKREDLAAAAKREQRALEKAGAPADETAAWQRIAALLQDGSADPGASEKPADALAVLFAAAHAAVERRIDKAQAEGLLFGDASRLLRDHVDSLVAIRNLLLRSAIAAGATIPSLDNPLQEKAA